MSTVPARECQCLSLSRSSTPLELLLRLMRVMFWSALWWYMMTMGLDLGRRQLQKIVSGPSNHSFRGRNRNLRQQVVGAPQHLERRELLEGVKLHQLVAG